MAKGKPSPDTPAGDPPEAAAEVKPSRLFALRPFNVALRGHVVTFPPGEITDTELLEHFGDTTPDGTERR